MAGELQFTLDYNRLKHSSGTLITPDEPVPFRDVSLQLCAQRRRSDDGSYISTDLKVFTPEIVKWVKLSFKIVIYHGSNRSTLYDQGSSSISYDDPGSPGCQFGSGPHKIGSSQMSFSNIEKRYLHKDGTIRFKVSVYNRYYQVEHDMGIMMKRMASFLEEKNKDLNFGGDQSNINQLKKQITLLEEENSKINQTAEEIEGELSQKKQDILDQERQVGNLEKSNQALTEENQSLIKQVAETKKKLEELNSEVASCKFVDALAAMKPDQVRLGECDKDGLQDFQRKLLVIQKMILQTITSKEKCQKCGKNSRECAMMPCKHLAYCLPCYQEVDQTRKTPPKKQQNKKNKKKQSEEEEKPFEPKPLTCPVCSTEVGQVINVQQ